jgi:hypothetical protein
MLFKTLYKCFEHIIQHRFFSITVCTASKSSSRCVSPQCYWKHCRFHPMRAKEQMTHAHAKTPGPKLFRPAAPLAMLHCIAPVPHIPAVIAAGIPSRSWFVAWKGSRIAVIRLI